MYRRATVPGGPWQPAGRPEARCRLVRPGWPAGSSFVTPQLCCVVGESSWLGMAGTCWPAAGWGTWRPASGSGDATGNATRVCATRCPAWSRAGPGTMPGAISAFRNTSSGLGPKAPCLRAWCLRPGASEERLRLSAEAGVGPCGRSLRRLGLAPTMRCPAAALETTPWARPSPPSHVPLGRRGWGLTGSAGAEAARALKHAMSPP